MLVRIVYDNELESVLVGEVVADTELEPVVLVRVVSHTELELEPVVLVRVANTELVPALLVRVVADTELESVVRVVPLVSVRSSLQYSRRRLQTAPRAKMPTEQEGVEPKMPHHAIIKFHHALSSLTVLV